MSRHTTGPRRGFTVIEAVVGSGIFLIGTLGAFSLLSWILQANANSGRIVEAAAAAQTKLEELVELGYDKVAAGTETAGRYALSWQVTPANQIKTIHLTAMWVDSGGRRGTFTASNMVVDTKSTAILPDPLLPGHGGVGGIPPQEEP